MRWLLTRARIVLVVVVALATGVLALHAARLGIEHDNASLTAADAAQTAIDAAFRSTFAGGDELLLTLTRPDLLEAPGLRQIDDVTRSIVGLDGVSRVWSLTVAQELAHGEAGAEPRLLIEPPWDARDVSERVRAAIDRNPDVTGWVVSADRRTAGFVIDLENRPADTEYRTRLIAALRALMVAETHDGTALNLTGVPVQKHDVSAYVERDQRVLLPLAVLALGSALAAFFRRPAGVLVPLGIAGITVVWTTGLYAWTGHQTNAITALLPPVLLTVALVVGVHVYEAWRAAAEPDRTARALAAVRAVAAPAALCTVTTAQGFLSLGVSDLPAVQQFGVFAAVGTIVAFAVGLTAMPALLTWLRPPQPSRGGHDFTLRLLDGTSRLATTRPGLIVTLFALVTAVAALGIPRIRANTDLVGFLTEDAPLRRDTAFIDAHLTGTLPFDFMITRRDGGPIASLDALRRLDELETATRARPHVTTVTSVLALVRQVHRAETGGPSLALPADEETLRKEIALLDGSGNELVRRFAAPELRALRLSVRLHAVGTAESAPLVDAVVTDGRRLLGPDYVLAPAGELYRVVHDSTGLVRQQVTSFGAAIVLVVLAIGILFRSVAFTVLALIPNVLPILWTGGLMGFAGIELSTGTAMIASAVLGLVVDDTIYYLSHYRRAFRGDAVAAVRETTRAVGAPVTAASASLIVGFLVGALSSFKPTIYFSVLTSLTMITGVVCDVLMLPASLVLLARMRSGSEVVHPEAEGGQRARAPR
jgi:predicted RND superfamily exporter protein